MDEIKLEIEGREELPETFRTTPMQATLATEARDTTSLEADAATRRDIANQMIDQNKKDSNAGTIVQHFFWRSLYVHHFNTLFKFINRSDI